MNNNVKSIYLSYYHKWDGHEHYKIAKKYGFIGRRKGPLSGNILNYDNIDEKLCEIHIWFKMLKFGFWRPTDQSCYQIWNNRMKRDEAVEIVLRTKKASISYVQRNLRIGYNRAARIIEDMEKAGLVTPMNSNGNREIIVNNNND